MVNPELYSKDGAMILKMVYVSQVIAPKAQLPAI
jgi:hypothetical protein